MDPRLPDPLLADLDADQRAAVTAEGPVVRVLAGPGSGKTRVLTRRIAWRVAGGDASADHTVALTFTRRAAAELRFRLAAMGQRSALQVGTMHALALTRLRRRAADAGRRPPRLESPATIMARAGVEEGRRELVAAEAGWAAGRTVGADGYAEAALAEDRRPGLPLDVVAAAIADYEAFKKRRRLVDYDDLLRAWTHALRTDRTFRRAERWRVRHLLVDEYQDLTPLQIDVVRTLRGPECDLFVVGDPDQSVYGFAGADPGGLDRLPEWAGETTTVHLGRNHRSRQPVADAAARLLGREPPPARPGGDPVRRLALADDGVEADRLADLLRDAHRDGRRWRDLAVLARTNRLLAVLESGLAGHGIPTARRARALDGSAAREAMATIRTAPTLRAGIESLVERLDATDDVTTRLGLRVVVELVEDLLRMEPHADRNDLAAFVALPPARIPGGHDAVDLVTFHGAKGLEWPVVVLAGVEDGTCPPVHATVAEVAEERRLLYVAMTRATDELHVTWCERRTGRDGRVVLSGPSPFVDDLPDAAPPPPSTEPVWREELSRQRRLVPGDPDRAGRARRAGLLAWRADAAAVARVPPTTILRDDLVDVLVRRPVDDEAALAAVTGWGPGLLRRLGPGVLAALREST